MRVDNLTGNIIVILYDYLYIYFQSTEYELLFRAHCVYNIHMDGIVSPNLDIFIYSFATKNENFELFNLKSNFYIS